METLFNATKDLILNEFNNNLENYENEQLSLPKVKENAVIFGSVDIQKLPYDVIIAFYPETSDFSEETIDGEDVEEKRITITIICKNDKYENLILKMCRYTQCFKDTIFENYSMNGIAKNINFGTIKYFSDAGITEKTVTATETELTIYV